MHANIIERIEDTFSVFILFFFFVFILFSWPSELYYCVHAFSLVLEKSRQVKSSDDDNDDIPSKISREEVEKYNFIRN